MSAQVTTYNNYGENVGAETYMIMTMNIKSNKKIVRRIIKKEEKLCWIVIIIAKVAIDDC